MDLGFKNNSITRPWGFLYFFLKSLFLILILFGLAKSSWAATYYISASGSDSNNGTSKNTPWLHAPGMVGCSGNCPATIPQPGDQFILRGGDTWHHDIFPWNWEWNGAPSGIYIGVDKTWYTGSSWTRPILNFDNPPSQTTVSSCLYDDAQIASIHVASIHDYVSYIHLDNFEITGVCWQSVIPFTGGGAVFNGGGVYNETSNFYFHGWTHTADCGCSSLPAPCYCDGPSWIIGPTYFQSFGHVHDNVIDGSDTDGHSANGVYSNCYNLHHNVFRYLANGANGGGHTIHDNLFEYIPESFDPMAHTNSLQALGEPAENNYFYNNLFRHLSNAQNIDNTPAPGYSDYIFNNVVYDYLQGSHVNYWSFEAGDRKYVNSRIHFWNNTLQFVDGNFMRNLGIAEIDFKNNHIISDYITSVSNLISNEGTPPATYTDAHSLYQDNAAAGSPSQGYTSSDEYAPSVANASTINAGQDLSANCTGELAALCYGFVPISYDAINHKVVYPGSAPSRGSKWDIGAYEYWSDDSTAPHAPSGLLVK